VRRSFAATGRAPSNEGEQVKQAAAAVRLSMEGSRTQPDVASRARAVRQTMEGTERDLALEARLASSQSGTRSLVASCPPSRFSIGLKAILDASGGAADTGRAMSQENVEVVRQMLQAFADGGLAAMAEFWDPDIDWRAAEGALDDAGEMHGPVAVRRYIQDWIDTFDDFSVVVEQLRDVGDNRVLGVQRLTGRAKLSGTETDLRYALVSTIRDGKVVRAREYMSLDQALEAVGLSE